jgi:hypothetical protein
MNNEKESEEYEQSKTPSEKQFDARVVHTVRNLKKQPSRVVGEDISNKSNELKSPNKQRGEQKIKKQDSKESKSNKDTFNGRISIDGSGQSTSDSAKFESINIHTAKGNNKNAHNSNHRQSKNISSIKLTTDFAPYKTKTEFQKRLMSENNIIKYKSMCVSILKEDEDIKKLCETTLIFNNTSTSTMFSNSNHQFEQFVDNNLFNDKFFLYNLESLLNSDVSKQKKEKFFKDEIKKIIDLKVLEIHFENKMKGIHSRIDNHINKIQNFQFFS